MTHDDMSEAGAGHLTFVMIGPLPPPIGGTTVSFDALCSFVAPRLKKCIVIDTVRRSGGSLSTAVSVARQLLRHVRRCDVVTMHFSDGASLAPILWLICRLARKPCVYRQFGGEFERTFSALPAWWQGLLIRTLLKSDAVFLQTKGMMTYFRPFVKALHWFPTARHRTPAAYAGRFARRQDDRLRCVFVGHVSRAKGIHSAIDAVAQFPDVELDIYGPLVDVSEQDLAGPRIRYRGVIPADAVSAKMAEYDLLLFPTQHAGEGYSGTLVEAAMIGLPIIATRWQSLPEMFREDEAIFIDPAHPHELVDAFKQVLSDPGGLLERSTRLIARSSDFDADEIFGKFLSTCVGLVKKSGN